MGGGPGAAGRYNEWQRGKHALAAVYDGCGC